MKYSYNWLQKHIDSALPGPKELEQLLTFKAFEVESIDQKEDDIIFDIKVLPDRSHDALSHFGMAKEIASISGLSSENIIKKEYKLPEPTLEQFLLDIEDTKASPRFMGVLIKNIDIKDSQDWLKQSLESIGQRSINNVVDATNYVLYDLGKPMHAFDADKISGAKIITRFAKEGETLITLDGKSIELDETTLVLADAEGPLDIAGIKGGTKAEVDKNTKNIVIVSSNFNSTLIRKTTAKVGIKTDAAKRFENGISSELCEAALMQTAKIILELAGNSESVISHVTDIYPKKEKEYKVGISQNEVNKVLGTNISENELQKTLDQRYFNFKKVNVYSEILKLASSLENKPYKRGASVLYDAPDCFDCSSLTAYLYKECGIAIPRIAIDQYVFSYERIGEPQIGDLIFTNTGEIKTKEGEYFSQVLQKNIKESAVRHESVEWMPGTKVEKGIDHVGVYVGDGYVMHATSSSGKIIKEKIEESKVFSNGYNVRYIINKTEDRFVVIIPTERLDLRIKEDIIDEISKLLGTQNSTPSTMYENVKRGIPEDALQKQNIVRDILISKGLSEVITYTFSNEGDIAILNSVDPKKNKLRTTLVPGIKKSLDSGAYYSQFLELENIEVFEIGKIFKEKEEKVFITVGLSSKNKIYRKNIKERLEEIKKSIGVENKINSFENTNDGQLIIEVDINDIKLPKEIDFIKSDFKKIVKYKTLSNYPFIVRDVAFFVPENTDESEIENKIRNKAGDLCVKFYLFDRFQKKDENRISLGYRMVFQSHEKTLTDKEVEVYTDKVYNLLNDLGFETR